MSNPRKLYRSRTDRIISGVCGGLGEYFGIDSTFVRTLFVVLAATGGGGLLIYIILAIVIPEKGTGEAHTGPEVGEQYQRFREGAQEFGERVREFGQDVREGGRGRSSSAGPCWLWGYGSCSPTWASCGSTRTWSGRSC